jgi:hypothetical protein
VTEIYNDMKRYNMTLKNLVVFSEIHTATNVKTHFPVKIKLSLQLVTKACGGEEV